MASRNDLELAEEVKQALYEVMVLRSQDRITDAQVAQGFYEYLIQLPPQFFTDADIKKIWQDKSQYGKGAYEIYTMAYYQASQRLLKERQSKK